MSRIQDPGLVGQRHAQLQMIHPGSVTAYVRRPLHIRVLGCKPWLMPFVAPDATNLVLVGGMNWGYDLSQIVTYPITGTNVVYDTHPYPYGGKQPSNWDASFGNISNTYAVISAESGEYDCGTSYMSQLLSYFDAHKIGWVGWSWVSAGSICNYPQLITDYSGMPAAQIWESLFTSICEVMLLLRLLSLHHPHLSHPARLHLQHRQQARSVNFGTLLKGEWVLVSKNFLHWVIQHIRTAR